VLEAVADETIAGCDLSVQIESAGAAIEKLNDVLLDAVRKALRRRNEIHAISVYAAGSLTPLCTAHTPHRHRPPLDSDAFTQSAAPELQAIISSGRASHSVASKA